MQIWWKPSHSVRLIYVICDLQKDPNSLAHWKELSHEVLMYANSEGQCGIGILLAEKWALKVFEVEWILARILKLKLILGKQIFTFIALYAPQANWTKADRPAFYDDLQSLLGY